MAARFVVGDSRKILKRLPDKSARCCVTSPPYYGLRDYGIDGQIGLEQTPDAYVDEIVTLFRDVRRVLKDDGTLWLNLGDSYWTAKGASCGTDPKQSARRGWARPQDRPSTLSIKGKDLIGIPWMVAFALRADGWYLRSDIIWAKPNPMPESVTDRPTAAHEHLFLLSKNSRYYFDAEAIREPRVSDEDANSFRGGCYVGGNKDNAALGKRTVAGNKIVNKQRGHTRRHAGFNDRWDAMTKEEQSAGGRNCRNVWTVSPRPFPEAHFATFPPALVEPCIKAGSAVGDIVIDPFGGAGTTALVCERLSRHSVSLELNPEYVSIAERRINKEFPGIASHVVAP